MPRSRIPPCRASLQERCASPVAAEKQRCLRKGCCRNRGKFTGISRRGSGSSCVWSPESRQRRSHLHSFFCSTIIHSLGENNHEILRGTPGPGSCSIRMTHAVKAYPCFSSVGGRAQGRHEQSIPTLSPNFCILLNTVAGAATDSIS